MSLTCYSSHHHCSRQNKLEGGNKIMQSRVKLSERLTGECAIFRNRWICGTLMQEEVIDTVAMNSNDAIIVIIHCYRYITVDRVEFSFHFTGIVRAQIRDGVVTHTAKSKGCKGDPNTS